MPCQDVRTSLKLASLTCLIATCWPVCKRTGTARWHCCLLRQGKPTNIIHNLIAYRAFDSCTSVASRRKRGGCWHWAGDNTRGSEDAEHTAFTVALTTNPNWPSPSVSPLSYNSMATETFKCSGSRPVRLAKRRHVSSNHTATASDKQQMPMQRMQARGLDVRAGAVG